MVVPFGRGYWLVIHFGLHKSNPSSTVSCAHFDYFFSASNTEGLDSFLEDYIHHLLFQNHNIQHFAKNTKGYRTSRSLYNNNNNTNSNNMWDHDDEFNRGNSKPFARQHFGIVGILDHYDCMV